MEHDTIETLDTFIYEFNKKYGSVDENNKNQDNKKESRQKIRIGEIRRKKILQYFQIRPKETKFLTDSPTDEDENYYLKLTGDPKYLERRIRNLKGAKRKRNIHWIHIPKPPNLPANRLGSGYHHREGNKDCPGRYQQSEIETTGHVVVAPPLLVDCSINRVPKQRKFLSFLIAPHIESRRHHRRPTTKLP